MSHTFYLAVGVEVLKIGIRISKGYMYRGPGFVLYTLCCTIDKDLVLDGKRSSYIRIRLQTHANGVYKDVQAQS